MAMLTLMGIIPNITVKYSNSDLSYLIDKLII